MGSIEATSGDSEKRWKEKILTEKTDARFEINPRFELYKIIIEDTPPDRIPNTIDISSSLRDETLYERKEGDPPLPIGVPLRFCAPTRPPICVDPLFINFGLKEWYWTVAFDHDKAVDKWKGPGPVSKQVIDEENLSKARIVYEEIIRSVEAHLQITLSYRDHPGCYQFGGEISATANGNLDTKRILLSTFDDDIHTPVKLGTALPLDRSVVAMSLGSMLHLHFGELSLTGETHKLVLNVDDCEIGVPEYPCKVSYVQKIESGNIVIKRRREGEFLDEDKGTFLNDKMDDEVVAIEVTWVSVDEFSFLDDPMDGVPSDDSDDNDADEAEGGSG